MHRMGPHVDTPRAMLHSMSWTWEACVVAAVLVGMPFVLALEVVSVETGVLLALMIVWTLGIIDSAQALSGFSNSGVMTIAFFFVVVAAVDRSRVLEVVTRRVLGEKTGLRMASFRLQVCVLLASALFNNVLLVTLLLPIISDWTLRRGSTPSRFLIPLSYATIAGGCLTMIGTAPCLIVQGLLIQKGLQQFSFFDPGLVTSAAAIIVVFYLTFISPLILPKDQPNLLEAVETQTRDIVTEIEFTEESVFTGKLLDVSVRKLGLQSSHVVKLRRKTESPFLPQEKSDEETYPPVSSEQELKEIAEANSEKFFEIFPVPLDIEIQAGDVLVLSGPPSELFPWANRKISVGLKVLNLNAKELAGSGTEFFEVVISRHCPFSGKSFSSEYFSRYYACRTVALRKRNSSGFLGASKFVNSQVTLQFGDSVLVLARPDFFKRWRLHSHFLLVIHKGNLPPKVTWFDYVPLVLFCGMLLFSSLHDYPLVKIATILAAFFFLGRWVNVKDLPQIADWNLLLMLSCALGFSTSIYSSGLDNDVAVLIQSASLGSYGSLFLVSVFVSVLAETVTYSAAAAIGLPFAVETANALGLSYRPFAMAALIASACCLATPIGNPVNTMIWAPGGYQFKDFLKLGLPMNLIYTLAATFIGPIFFPFNPTT